jgi:hypothetical protein
VVAKGSDLGFSAGLTQTAQSLGVAFHTTLVGLVAVIPILAMTTYVRQHAQSLLEQQNKFFLRLIAREFSAIGAIPHGENQDQPLDESPILAESDSGLVSEPKSLPVDQPEIALAGDPPEQVEGRNPQEYA